MPLSRIVLASGRTAELSELRLSGTYDGMLEGHPCRPVNDMKTRGLLRAAERAFPATPAHLVPPSLERPDEDAGAFGPVEVLPAVACIGLFRSAALGPDPVLHRSALTVAWFQPAPGIPSGADPALRDIPWEELAQDYEL
ncbi:hypothetical protein [Actinoallomurus acaciae]|uniref:Uncharacterized protein n=1 Tax=Actinoallomurus acaciae TaxID=502577 RepID=A0ABV5YW25_9ACTN